MLTDALIGTFADAGDADLRANRCFLYHVIGGGTGDWVVPVGGMGALTDALAARGARRGAELRTGAEVTASSADGDGAEVALPDGGGESRVRRRPLLFDAAPAELARLLGERRPASAPEGAQLKVNLLLRGCPACATRAVDPSGLRRHVPRERDRRRSCRAPTRRPRRASSRPRRPARRTATR